MKILCEYHFSLEVIFFSFEVEIMFQIRSSLEVNCFILEVKMMIRCLDGKRTGLLTICKIIPRLTNQRRVMLQVAKMGLWGIL